MPKCTIFKRALAVCKISLNDEFLSPVLLKNVNSWVASRPIRLYMILWVTTKSFLILLCRGSVILVLCVYLHNNGLYALSPTSLLPIVFFLGCICPFLRQGQFALMAFSDVVSLTPYKEERSYPSSGILTSLIGSSNDIHWGVNAEFSYNTIPRPLICSHFVISYHRSLTPFVVTCVTESTYKMNITVT